jgi:cupin 2 domain-containing protein
MNKEHGNIFAAISGDIDNESFEGILDTGSVRIERIISTGQASPEGFWYDQSEDEWVVVLRGEGVVEFEDGQKHSLQKGDYLFIPAHLRHRLAWTKPAEVTLWLAVHIKV